MRPDTRQDEIGENQIQREEAEEPDTPAADGASPGFLHDALLSRSVPAECP
jgi:hypothetical protein